MFRDLHSTNAVRTSCRRFTLLAVLLASLFLSVQTRATTVTSQGNATDPCTPYTECCISFTITFSEATDKIRLTLLEPGASDACLDVACFESTDNPPTATHTRVSNGVFEITFNPVRASGTYTFTLCGSPSCWLAWTAYKWEASLSGSAIDDGGDYLHHCSYGNAGCNGCDKTELYQIGDDIMVCFSKKGSAGDACTLRVEIKPALKDCNNIVPGTNNSLQVAPDGFHFVSQTNSGVAPNTSTEIILAANGPTQCLPTCYTRCFRIKGCPPGDINNPRISHSVKVTNTDDPSAACDPPPSRTFKPTTNEGYLRPKEFKEEQNYPNPVTALTGFTTLIPFDMDQAGQALLTIMSESGAVVHTQEFNADGAGTFGFSVNAGILPSGTYFYQVESPRGRTIVSKTMVVIK
jgi:hypothetical protein